MAYDTRLSVSNRYEDVAAPLAAVSPEVLAENEKRAHAEEQRQAAAELLRRQQSLVRLGVPAKDVERIVLSRYEDNLSMAAVQRLVENEGIIVLSGIRGCGKTTAAAWWVAQPGPQAKFFESAAPMFLSIAKIQRISRYQEQQVGPLERARRLVIDDLGAEYTDAKGAIASFLDGIINERYANMLPTLITTNLQSAEFKRNYGERIADRIRETGEFVSLKGGSMRSRRATTAPLADGTVPPETE